MIYVLGSDISHWNFENIRAKLQTLWGYGYRFVYIKTSESTGWVDPNWREIYDIAKDLGYKVGPYHYFIPSMNGQAQAAHFWNVVRDVEWDMKPMSDVEEPNHYPIVPIKSVYAARIKACLHDIEDLFGRRAIVYTSANIWNNYVDAYVEEELMVAHWTSRPQPVIPRQWQGRGWTVWQFSVNVLDRDRFNGDYQKFLEWLGKTLPPPPVGDLEERVIELEAQVAELIAWINSYQEATP